MTATMSMSSGLVGVFHDVIYQTIYILFYIFYEENTP
jgi:hypothetical protein